MDFLLHYRSFTGNALELAQAAIDCAAAIELDIDPDKTNERLIRYYQSEGVLDRPDRQGRDSAYHFRHLVQLLTARRMVIKGLPLALAMEHNSHRSTDDLEASLRAPLPNAAEMLVSRFKSMDPGKSSLSMRQKSSSTRPPMAVVDVLAEVQTIKRDLMDEIRGVRDLKDEVMGLRRALMDQLQKSEEGYYKMRDLIEQLHDMNRHFEKLLHESLDHQKNLEHMQFKMMSQYESNDLRPVIQSLAAQQADLVQHLLKTTDVKLEDRSKGK